jgi:hypothetical protein
MIFATASEALGLVHHEVNVDLTVKGMRYIVTVEEEWREATNAHFKEPKKVTLEFETVEEFLSEARIAFWDDEECPAELQGFDPTLLEDAMRAAYDRVSDVLLFGGAAHLEDPAEFVIDWDEAKCRRLIKKAAEE